MEESRKNAVLKELEALLGHKSLKHLTREEIAVILFEEVIEKVLDAEKDDWAWLMYSHGDLRH